MTVVEQWSEWLSSLAPDKINGLKEALGIAAKSHVRVTRLPTESAYVKTPTYVDVLELFAIYDKLAFKSNIMLKGPKGVGKSLSYMSWAHVHNIPIVSIECSEDTKKYDLMGSPFIIGDETVYVLGGIPTAIDIANEVGQCILAFEEVNSLTPQVQKQLNAISDFRQSVSIPSVGKSYRLREGAKIWIVASMNPAIYGGTYDLNEDLKSRFEEIEISYPQDNQERQILKSVGTAVDKDLLGSFLMLAKETRSGTVGYPLSTRDLVRITNSLFLVGLDTTLQMLIGKFENEDKDIILKRLPSIFASLTKLPTKFWGAP